MSSPLFGNDDLVPVLEFDVLLEMFAFNHFLVIERDLLAVAQNIDFLSVGKLAKSSGTHNGVEHRRLFIQGELTGFRDRSDDKNALAVNLGNRDRNLGIVDVAVKALRYF